jgi:hypothetical protein
MSTSRRTVRVIALAAAVCVALAVMASLTVAKGGKAKYIGPINQPPATLGQATVELKVKFAHKGKKLVPKSFEGKERNLYIHCADGTDGYPTDGGAGDAITGSHIEIESTVFVKKNGTFNHTDIGRGDVDSGTFNIQGKFKGRSASGTLRMENHRNNGSPPPNDDLTCDSGVLSWTASAP